jgi:hypothetical protein
MIHVHTFSTGLKIFHSIEELKSLDEQVNAFLKENNIKNVISVSDTCTSDTTGATIGLIRVLAYEK